MTAFVLLSGTLFRAPERRTSKNGTPFTTAVLRERAPEGSDFWSVVAFGDAAQAELLRLGEGDAVSVQGSLRIETYDSAGVAKISRSVTAAAVLPLRPAPRQRAVKTEVKSTQTGEKSGPPAFDDTVPF